MTRLLLKAMGCAEMATALGIVIFWLLFFSAGMAPEKPPPCYVAFEHAFPLADLVLSLALLAAGGLLLRDHVFGRMLSLVCAGGLVFLGLVDFSFNLRNGIYTSTLREGLIAALINLWCIALGIGLAAGLWPIVAGQLQRPAAPPH
jgi:hypothetical protein